MKRVVVTSSLAAVRDKSRNTGGHVYTEVCYLTPNITPNLTYDRADWCSVTAEDVKKDSALGYVGSKTLAEQAAWKYIEKEKPSFALSVVSI